MVAATRIQHRRGTAEAWLTANPILEDGEIGIETDTGILRVGNGTSPWVDLAPSAQAVVSPTAAEWFIRNPILGNGVVGIERDTQIIKVGNGVTRWNDLAPTNSSVFASKDFVLGNYVAKATSVYNVKDYGAKGDGLASDNAAFQTAINAVSAAGGGTLFVPKGTYLWTAGVQIRSNVIVLGEGRSTVITANTNIEGFITPNVNVSNFTIRGLTFLGKNIVEGVYPRRSRNTTGPGMQSAFHILGNNRPTGTVTIENIVIEDCNFLNIPALPVLLEGIKGRTIMTNCLVSNSLDVGFIFCQSVIFSNNYVEKSADNGVSVSRENELCVVSDNVFVDGAYLGIWVSGFDAGAGLSNPGPDTFTIVGNVVRNFGYGGIGLRDGVRYGVCANNVIDGITAGPTDQVSDDHGYGIHITGYPSQSTTGPTEPTQFAEQIIVSGNLIRNCARGGMNIRGCRDIKISDNFIIDYGKATYVGSATTTAGTAVPTTTYNYNTGIFTINSLGMRNIFIEGNTFLDLRATPVANYGVHFAITDTPGSFRRNNRTLNLRNPNNEGGGVGQPTDTATTFIVDAANGALRDISFRTAGSRRWDVRVDNVSEDGTGAGSKFSLIARNDDGSFARNVIVADRLGNLTLGDPAATIGFFGNTPRVKGAATEDIRVLLVQLGLLTGGGASPLNLNGGKLSAGEIGVTGVLAHSTGNVGFFGQTPVAKPNVTGSRTDGTALASLLTALSSLGLISNNTTA